MNETEARGAPRWQPRWLTLAVALIVLAALALRLINLGVQSSWNDEAISAVTARGPALDILTNQYRSLHPPGYYLFLFYWRGLFGESDLALRLPSALMGAAAVLVMFFAGRRLFSPATGLWAALVTALMPFHLFYSQEMRMYSQLFLLSALAILTMDRLWPEGGRRRWLAYGLVSVLGLYTHYFYTLLMGALALYFIWRRWRTAAGPSWRAFLAVHLGLLLAFAPLLALLPGQLSQTNYGWRPAEGITSLLTMPLQFTVGLFLGPWWALAGFGLVLTLLLITLLQSVRALIQEAGIRWPLTLALVSYWAPIGVLLAATILWTPVLVPRLAIAAVPGLYLLLAWGASQTRERRFNALLLLLLLLVALRADYNWLFDKAYAKPEARAAARILAGLAEPGEPIVYASDSGFRLFIRYEPELDHRLFLADPDRPQIIPEAFRRMGGEVILPGDPLPETFWLVLHQDFEVEEQEAIYADFAARYEQIDYVNVDNIRLYRFAGRG